MTAADLLKGANFDAWESVQSALEKLPDRPPKRAQWLVQHIREMKLEYAGLIAQALSRPAPLHLELDVLMAWEVQRAEELTPTEFSQTLQYGSRTMTVGEVISLNARHSVWHASQLAALLSQS